VTVLELKNSEVNHGRARASRLKLQNINFRQSDAAALKFPNLNKQQSDSGNDDKVFDLFVGLHACGALTDVILQHAVSCRASFLVCTCCFRSNKNLLVNGAAVNEWYLKSIKNERHVENEEIKCGFNFDETDIQNAEFVAERQGDVSTQFIGVHSINALRAHVVSSKFTNIQDEIISGRCNSVIAKFIFFAMFGYNLFIPF